MPGPVFNQSVLQFDIYSLPVAVAGLFTLGFGLSVLFIEGASRVSVRFLSFATAVGLYVFAAGVSYALVSPRAVLLWDRIAHIGVVFIPFTLLITSLRTLGRKRTLRPFVIAAFFFAVLCGAAVLGTDVFIVGTKEVFWGHYPRYGILGYVFLAYFAVTIVGVLVLFFLERRRTPPGLHRSRLTALIVALAIGTIGAVDFLPAIGVRIYAFGYIPISIFVLITGFVVVHYKLVDITPEMAAKPVLASMHAAVIVTDNADVIRVANPAARRYLGYENKDLLELRFARVRGAVRTPAQEGRWEEEWTDEVGRVRNVSIAATPIVARHRRHGWVYVAHDISDRVEQEMRLQEIALHDPLTGLANRALFFDRLAFLVAGAKRNNEIFAILFVDLDGFKAINDRLGHAAGDAVLKTVAERMTACFRRSDTLARIGGDEFVGMCGRITAPEHGKLVAQKILGILVEPVDTDHGRCTVGASIGVAIFPADGSSEDELVAAADRAMYHAKHKLGGGIVAACDVPPDNPDAT